MAEKGRAPLRPVMLLRNCVFSLLSRAEFTDKWYFEYSNGILYSSRIAANEIVDRASSSGATVISRPLKINGKDVKNRKIVRVIVPHHSLL